jgi:hypothetical protein
VIDEAEVCVPPPDRQKEAYGPRAGRRQLSATPRPCSWFARELARFDAAPRLHAIGLAAQLRELVHQFRGNNIRL